MARSNRNRDRGYVDAREKYATVNVQPPAIKPTADGKLTIEDMEKMLATIAADLSPRGTYRTIHTNGTGYAAPEWLTEQILPSVVKEPRSPLTIPDMSSVVPRVPGKRRSPKRTQRTVDPASRSTDCTNGHHYTYPQLIGLHACEVCGHQMLTSA